MTVPRITVKIGTREELAAQISKATPMGALGTEAMVRIGQLLITGPAPALRHLADACNDAALMAEQYDADPAGYDALEGATGGGDAIERP
jgi:hypothetical protein